MDPNVTIDGLRGRINPQNGMVSFQADDRVNVVFYKKSVIDPVLSRQHGRPFNVAKDYVRIQQPGEKDYADRPVADDISVTARWPAQWAAYQQNQQQVPAGTPLELLFPNNPDIAANLKQLHVHTVEQLAHLTAEGVNQIGMGATQWKNAAAAYLEQAQRGVAHHQHAKDLADRDNKIEVLERNQAALQQQLNRLLAERQGIPSEMVPQRIPEYLAQAPSRPLFDVPVAPVEDAEQDDGDTTIIPPRRGPGRPRKAA